MAMSNYSQFNGRSSGLTLIEVLIALAIVAIALTAVVKTASQNIRNTSYVQEKTMAHWVGLQVINEVRLGLMTLSQSEDSEEKSTTMLGRTFFWRAQEEPTPNKRIDQIQVHVYGADHHSLANLVGYVYKQ